eukprot:TRINITY_DN9278_c0_g1_i1.p1 TRINITY_DN9278_c0_g1~~TRINITY_DN9278_c0_g1_i1.p1  ORF type:complete len:116 (-),score=12.29 TRINITY_DN9278_c0_g1_i1:43-390(-)
MELSLSSVLLWFLSAACWGAAGAVAGFALCSVACDLLSSLIEVASKRYPATYRRYTPYQPCGPALGIAAFIANPAALALVWGVVASPTSGPLLCALLSLLSTALCTAFAALNASD